MNAAAYGQLGDRLLAERDFEGALQAYAAALEQEPDNAVLRFLCGETLYHLGRYADAIDCLQDLTPPDDHPALAVEHAMTLGRALQQLGHTEAAELHLLKAYALQPGNEDAVCNLAALYETDGRHAMALQFLEPVMHLHPNSARLHYNLGSALLECGQTARGMLALQRTLDIAPLHARAHQNLALAALVGGDLPTGWAHYRWRANRLLAVGTPPAAPPQVTPLPADLRGHSVRVIGEQGIGDELFFMRYLPTLRARGATVHYQLCNRKLLPLMPQAMPALIDTLDSPDTAADFSVWAGDLPLALGADALTGYPSPLALQANPAQVQAWQARQPLLQRARPRLGIAWRAGTAGQAPAATGAVRWLSKQLPLESLMQVLAPLPIDLVVLQRQPQAQELDYIAQCVGTDRLLDASTCDQDLNDLLALLSLLDGLVGVSNTNVHLAAGLGVAIDTLVPLPYEFRWQAQGESSPWFPGSCVYRQQPGDWQPALRQLQARLQQRYTAA